MRISLSLCLTALLLGALSMQAQTQSPTTARGIVEEIKKNVGVPWMTDTVDTFKAGDPDAPVTGVAVTMMATMDVLQRAAAKNLNFVITHEPTFYAHRDTGEGLAQDDPVWKEKRDFIAVHHMVVFRFHDHWHERAPDGVEAGVMHTLGWEKYQSKENQFLFTLPETPLKNLAKEVAKKMDSSVVRVIGNPDKKVTKIGISPGASGLHTQSERLMRPDVQVLLIGEAAEWEGIEYADDAVAQKRDKALIVIGHIPSEQPGMEECTKWLKTFVHNLPIEFVPAKQPFWPVR